MRLGFNKKPKYIPEPSGGIIIGANPNNPNQIQYEQDLHHVLLSGITGWGKTRRLFAPTVEVLMRNFNSFLINDTTKQQYYRFKNRLEEAGYEVILMDFRDPNYGLRYNPCSTVVRMLNEGDFDEAQMMCEDIVEALVPLNDKQEPMWTTGARSLISATMLSLCISKQVPLSAKNIPNVFNNIVTLGKSDKEGSKLDEYFESPERTPVEKMAYGTYGMSQSKVRMSYNSVATANIREYTYGKIARSTAYSDFDISTWGSDKHKPVACFVVVPDEKSTLEKLSTFFIEQVYRELITTAKDYPQQKLPRRFFFVLDEAMNMGQLSNFDKRLNVSRQRNICYILGIQSDPQIDLVYGKDRADAIRKGCTIKIWLDGADGENISHIQKQTGEEAYVKESVSKHSNLSIFNINPNNNSTYTSAKRPLYSTDFLTTLQTPKAIIKKAGMFPFVSYLPDFSEYAFSDELVEMHPSEEQTRETKEEIMNQELNKDYLFLLNTKSRSSKAAPPPAGKESQEKKVTEDKFTAFSKTKNKTNEEIKQQKQDFGSPRKPYIKKKPVSELKEFDPTEK